MSGSAAKKTVPPEEIIAGKRQQLETLRAQCYQVERMLAICTDQHNRLDAENAGLMRGIAVNEQKSAESERALDDNVAFMKNYSKQSDEMLKVRRERLAKSVAEAEAENALLRQKLLDTKERKEAELRKFEDEADAAQHQMDEKALLFGMQLKEALERMRS